MADETGKRRALELAYQAVMHVEKAETMEVLDDPTHIMGMPTFSGLCLFGDGSVVPLRYAGCFNIRDGVGDFRGVARWRFAEGDIKGFYEGLIAADADLFEFSATVHDLTGTGRYEDVSGKGEFKGRRYEAVTSGGATHLTGSLTLHLVK